MTRFLRRFLVLAALMFWQGGFTFYAAVVIKVGQDVLGSHRRQGFVTRRVAQYLNLLRTNSLFTRVEVRDMGAGWIGVYAERNLGGEYAQLMVLLQAVDPNSVN